MVGRDVYVQTLACTVLLIISCVGLGLISRLYREDDVRHISLDSCCVVVQQIYWSELDTRLCEACELCETCATAKRLCNLLLVEVHRQDERVPLAQRECLVKTQSLVLHRSRTINEICKVVAHLVENQVLVNLSFCVKHTEVVEYCPLTITCCYRRFVVLVVTNHDTQADCSLAISESILRHCYIYSVNEIACAIEVLACIVDVLLCNVKLILNGLRHIAYLVKRGNVHVFIKHRFLFGVIGIQHTCKELCLLCCREAFALYLICTIQGNNDVLIKNTSLVGYACTVILRQITMEILV